MSNTPANGRAGTFRDGEFNVRTPVEGYGITGARRDATIGTLRLPGLPGPRTRLAPIRLGREFSSAAAGGKSDPAEPSAIVVNPRFAEPFQLLGVDEDLAATPHPVALQPSVADGAAQGDHRYAEALRSLIQIDHLRHPSKL